MTTGSILVFVTTAALLVSVKGTIIWPLVFLIIAGLVIKDKFITPRLRTDRLQSLTPYEI